MLGSERVVIQSPTSFTGSARRIWKLTHIGAGSPVGPWLKWLLLVWIALLLVAIAWLLVAVYTVIFGVLLVPWRLVRRGQRKRKQQDLRHREVLDASERRQEP